MSLNKSSAIAAQADSFVIERTFNAPRDLVFKAWTEKEHLLQWFGPKGFTMQIGTLDLRAGGSFHYSMTTPDGKEMWGKWVFREVTPTTKIVLVNSFSDKHGGLTRHPFADGWPLEMLTTTTFTEQQGRTTIKLVWAPINATPAEHQVFRDGMRGMEQGWGGTFEQLEDFLAKASR